MPMLVAEGVSNWDAVTGIFTNLIAQAPTFINFVCTTFPLNIGVAVGVAGMVTSFIFKLRPSAKV